MNMTPKVMLHCLVVVLTTRWISGLRDDVTTHAPAVTEQIRTTRLSDEERLLKDLFMNYNPSARPVIASKKTVKVKMQFSLMHIQELDVKSQILTATGLLILEWNDERLTWNENDYHITELVVEARKLWVPEFAIINGAEEIYGDYREFRSIVSSEGQVRWEPGGVFKTMCQIDITYFPFDNQECALVFGAWSYHTTKMNLTNTHTEVNLDSYEKNGEWSILTTLVRRDEFFYECCPGERFSNVAFHLHIQRRYTFYVMNVILPSMVTSILLLSIFYCPPAQKVQIGVVVLLSFRIFLLNVTDSIPKTSDHIPLLGIYLTCTMAITTLSMVLTVFILNLHGIADRPVPAFVRIVVLVHLAKLFCMSIEKDRKNTDKVTSSSTTSNKQSNYNRHQKRKKCATISNKYNRPLAMVDDDMDEPIIALNGSMSSNHGTGQETSFMQELINKNHNYAKQPEVFECVHAGNNEDIRFLPSPDIEENAEEDEEPDFSKDWHRLAEVVDRLFFWTFLIAIIAISILLFHPLGKEVLSNRPKTAAKR